MEIRKELCQGFVHDGTCQILPRTKPEHGKIFCRVSSLDLLGSKVSESLDWTTVIAWEFKKVHFFPPRNA
jgi:hypothetical protein